MSRDVLPAHRCDTVIWRDEALAGAEWLRGTYSDFAYAPHAHDAACLAVITPRRAADPRRRAGVRRPPRRRVRRQRRRAARRLADRRRRRSLRTIRRPDRLRTVLTGEP
jgi:hypothetical protein